jgi:hypothetical protein
MENLVAARNLETAPNPVTALVTLDGIRRCLNGVSIPIGNSQQITNLRTMSVVLSPVKIGEQQLF